MGPKIIPKSLSTYKTYPEVPWHLKEVVELLSQHVVNNWMPEATIAAIARLTGVTPCKEDFLHRVDGHRALTPSQPDVPLFQPPLQRNAFVNELGNLKSLSSRLLFYLSELTKPGIDHQHVKYIHDHLAMTLYNVYSSTSKYKPYTGVDFVFETAIYSTQAITWINDVPEEELISQLTIGETALRRCIQYIESAVASLRHLSEVYQKAVITHENREAYKKSEAVLASAFYIIASVVAGFFQTNDNYWCPFSFVTV